MAEQLAIDAIDDEEETGLMQLVGFGISDERFGVDILAVQEIIRAAAVTAVPNSPDFVEGVINLRGEIIPVIDLRKRLNLYREDRAQERNWILILSINNGVIGFIVDRVTEVFKIEEDTIKPPPEIIVTGLENQYIEGVCEIDGTLLITLDFKQVLFNEEYHALKDVHYDEVTLDEEVAV